MLEDNTYEPLAEVYIKVDESNEDIYCLCSRVVIRGKVEEDYYEQEIIEEEEEIEEVETKTEPQTEAKKKEEEVPSCYCSASHCSTDEHDSVRENALHSDSGADISEGSRDFEFDRYWAVNGERIVWESWISKYGEYIDPTYYNEDVEKNSFAGLIDVHQDNEIPNSDLLQLDSHEQDIASESDCGDDYFRLRSCSRSSISSIVTDSLTNVTPMTIYSSEFSYGGEESLQSSNSILSSTDSVSSNDQQWQQLWMEHFNQQYETSYKDFFAELNQNLPEPDQYKPIINHTEKSYISRNQTNSVGYLLGSLKSLSVDKESLTPEEMDSSVSDLVNDSCTSKCCDSETAKSSDVSTVIACESLRNIKNRKRAHDKDDPSLERVKGAFTLMGFVFKPAEPVLESSIRKAHVIYRKRNIRSHNRSLILKSAQPRHIRYNEDGEPIKTNSGDDHDNAAQLVRPLEPDNFSEKDDSSSDEEVSMPVEDWANANNKQKEKQKKKKMSKKKGKSWKANLPKEIVENTKLLKYWYKRYRLFSKFDDGIKLDEESWFSVTPEKVSKHTAERCRSDLIIDACCGAGGNTIQFAFTCQRVVAIDIDPCKIALAKHNAAIYGVEDRIEFIVGDFLQLAPKLKADVVFLSPPWGGPSYLSDPTYGLKSIGTSGGGKTLYEAAISITENVAYFLPKNINTDELVKMVGPGGSIEVEQNFLDKKLVAVTAYFGGLVEPI